MGDIKLNSETLQYISLFERMTKAKVMDCYEGYGKLVFVVNNGHIGIAVGKKGETIKMLRERMKKDIQVVEYSNNPEKFLKSIFHPFKPESVELEQRGNKMHATVKVAAKNKGKAIGRNGDNLRVAREIALRHHNIESVSVA